MAISIPFSAACERNKDVILETISPYLSNSETVLEIGSGTAQHALHFAKQNPHLKWQTSDQKQYLEGITAQLKNSDVANIHLPFELNVNQMAWQKTPEQYEVIYTANTLHIMSWNDVQAFFAGLHQVTKDNAQLIVYGPFKYKGEFTSPSNQAFDQSLQERGVGSGIRDFEAVNELASNTGFNLIEDYKMPANNQCLVWQKGNR